MSRTRLDSKLEFGYEERKLEVDSEKDFDISLGVEAKPRINALYIIAAMPIVAIISSVVLRMRRR